MRQFGIDGGRLWSWMAAVIVALGMTPAAAQEATDYLGLPGPIQVGGADYALAWSSQPAENYTKQEYLPAGEALPNYSRMVLVEVLTGEISPGDALSRQVAMLDERRAGDPITNYQVIENAATGEMLLDFVLSARDENGEYIIEWNAYRYAPLEAVSGAEGVLLFGISHRAYGNAASQQFLQGLAAFKAEQITALVTAELPDL